MTDRAPSFTPGPWRVVDTGTPLGREIVDANGGAIGFRTHGSDDQALANATLIAAAPELYETLREVLDFWSGAAGGRWGDGMGIRASAVLARVAGEAR